MARAYTRAIAQRGEWSGAAKSPADGLPGEQAFRERVASRGLPTRRTTKAKRPKRSSKNRRQRSVKHDTPRLRTAQLDVGRLLEAGALLIQKTRKPVQILSAHQSRPRPGLSLCRNPARSLKPTPGLEPATPSLPALIACRRIPRKSSQPRWRPKTFGDEGEALRRPRAPSPGQTVLSLLVRARLAGQNRTLRKRYAGDRPDASGLTFGGGAMIVRFKVQCQPDKTEPWGD
jgi:hypothetical protein